MPSSFVATEQVVAGFPSARRKLFDGSFMGMLVEVPNAILFPAKRMAQKELTHGACRPLMMQGVVRYDRTDEVEISG